MDGRCGRSGPRRAAVVRTPWRPEVPCRESIQSPGRFHSVVCDLARCASTNHDESWLMIFMILDRLPRQQIAAGTPVESPRLRIRRCNLRADATEVVTP